MIFSPHFLKPLAYSTLRKQQHNLSFNLSDSFFHIRLFYSNMQRVLMAKILDWRFELLTKSEIILYVDPNEK